MKSFLQLRALIFKNILLRRRNISLTFLEFLLPLVLVLLIVLLKGVQNTDGVYRDILLWSDTYADNDDGFILQKPNLGNYSFVTSFENLDNKKQEQFKKTLKSICGFKEVIVTDEAEIDNMLISVLTDRSSKPLIGGASILEQKSEDLITFVIKLRMINLFLTSNLYPPKTSPFPYSDADYYFGYIKSHFINLQYCLSETYSEITENNTDRNTTNLVIKKIPYPKNSGKIDWNSAVPLVIAFGWLISCLLLAKRICEEWQNKCKQMFHVMGVSYFIYWFHHFITSMIIMLIQSVIISFILIINIHNESIVKNAGFFLLLIIMLLYSASAILFSMTVAAVIRKPKFAIVCIFLLWSLSILVTKISLDLHRHTLGFTSLESCSILMMLLLPNFALENAFVVLQLLGSLYRNEEVISIGHLSLQTLDEPKLGVILLLMLLSLLLYTLAIMILDCDYSILNIKHWFSKSQSLNKLRKPGIQIENLTKRIETEDNGMYALHNVSFEAKYGEITAILGEISSGKSTIINILTGICSATSGRAFINGYNIETDMKKAHSDFSVCWAFNVFYDEFTVHENLMIFAAIKGLNKEEVNRMSTFVLCPLQLSNRKNVKAKNLSLNSQRKLAVAIAFVGESKTVVLDEPTLGMDCKSALLIWEALLNFASERVILVTTKSVDEATYIGNRLIVLVAGHMRTQESADTLKKNYNLGYRITLDKLKNWNFTAFEQLMNAYFAKNAVRLISQDAFKFTIHLEQKQIHNVHKFISDLNHSVESIGVQVADVTISTMEILLLQLCFGFQRISSIDVPKHPTVKSVTLQPLSFWTSFKQVFNIRFAFLSRAIFENTWHVLLALLLLSLLFFIESIFVNQIENSETKFNLSQMYGSCNALIVASDTSAARKAYNEVLQQYGIAMLSTNHDIKSYLKNERQSPDIQTYRERYLVGAQFVDNKCDSRNVTVFYNRDALHSLPASINLIFEAMQICDSNNTRNSSYSLQFESKQISYKFLKYLFVPVPIRFLYLSLLWLIFAYFVLFPLYFISYIRRTKNYILIECTRMKQEFFWFTNFIFDILFQFSFCILFFLLFFQRGSYIIRYPLLGAALLTLLFMFSMAIIPLIYIVSSIFRGLKKNICFILTISFIFGFIAAHIIAFIEISNLQINQQSFIKILHNALIVICEISPVFAVVWGIQKLISVSYRLLLCDTISYKWKAELCSIEPIVFDDQVLSSTEIFRCCQQTCSQDVCFLRQYFNPFLFGDYGILQEIIVLFIDTILYWILFLLLNKMFHSKLRNSVETASQIDEKIAAYHSLTKIYPEVLLSDEDVNTECKNVAQTLSNRKAKDKAVIVRNLVKKYGTCAFVNNVSFEVQRGNVFGLLGIRGSGNSILLRIIAGELQSTNGFVVVNGYKPSEKLYATQIGYSPKKSALLSKLTVKEMVMFYARMRGLSLNDAISETSDILMTLKIESIANKYPESLTSVEQKKVTIAISFAGIPAIILLDSPFYGIDEKSKNEIIVSISKLKCRHNSTIILTSSRVDECEPICNRIGVMSLGQLRCIGPPRYLRNKYGKGYFILIKLNKESFIDKSDEAAVTKFISKTFQRSSLVNRYEYLLQYYIGDDKSLSKETVFAKIENISDETGRTVHEYFITKASLEQFITASYWTQTMFNKC